MKQLTITAKSFAMRSKFWKAMC